MAELEPKSNNFPVSQEIENAAVRKLFWYDARTNQRLVHSIYTAVFPCGSLRNANVYKDWQHPILFP